MVRDWLRKLDHRIIQTALLQTDYRFVSSNFDWWLELDPTDASTTGYVHSLDYPTIPSIHL